MSAIALAVGAMYVAQKESKSTEGDKSIFHDRGSPSSQTITPKIRTWDSTGSRGSDGKSDARMNSADIRQAMHKAPGKD